MNADIALIIEIQKIDEQLMKLKDARDQAFVFIEDLKRSLEEKKIILQKMKENFKEIEKKVGLEELNVKTYEEKIKKIQETQKLIKTDKEFQAMQKAAKDTAALKAKAEDDLLNHITDKESLGNELSEIEKELDEMFNKLKIKQEEFEKEEKDFESMEGDFCSNRDIISNKINKEYYRIYEHVRKNKKFPAITAVAMSGACTGCYRVLPPQQYNELLSESKFMQCPICGKIIYAEENHSNDKSESNSAEGRGKKSKSKSKKVKSEIL